MIKKLLCTLCFLVFCLTLVGCNDQKEKTDDEQPIIPQPRTSQVEVQQ